jgi:hypothetical protein
MLRAKLSRSLRNASCFSFVYSHLVPCGNNESCIADDEATVKITYSKELPQLFTVPRFWIT